MSLPAAFVKNVLETRSPVLTNPGDYESTRRVLQGFHGQAWDPLLIELLDSLVPGLVRAALLRFKFDSSKSLVDAITDLRMDAKTEAFIADLGGSVKRFRTLQVCLFDLALVALGHEPDISRGERMAALTCLFDPINAMFSSDVPKVKQAALDFLREFEQTRRNTGTLG